MQERQYSILVSIDEDAFAGLEMNEYLVLSYEFLDRFDFRNILLVQGAPGYLDPTECRSLATPLTPVWSEAPYRKYNWFCHRYKGLMKYMILQVRNRTYYIHKGQN